MVTMPPEMERDLAAMYAVHDGMHNLAHVMAADDPTFGRAEVPAVNNLPLEYSCYCGHKLQNIVGG